MSYDRMMIFAQISSCIDRGLMHCRSQSEVKDLGTTDLIRHSGLDAWRLLRAIRLTS